MKKIKVHRVMDSKKFSHPKSYGASYTPEVSGCRVVMSAARSRSLRIEANRLAELRETMEDYP